MLVLIYFYYSVYGDGFGVFLVLYYLINVWFKVFVMGDNRDYVWEYVLVFLFNCCLNWLEMCVVKDFFWFDEEMVM